MLFLKKQPRLTPEINPLPSLSSTLTDQPDPEVIDNSSCSTESQDNVTDRGVKVQVNNSVLPDLKQVVIMLKLQA